MQLAKTYEPQQVEPRWARWWIESGIYQADRDAPGDVFSLVIPPPNVTGSLHMGHMFEHSIIDTLVRWHRMLGDNTLWLPGTDHAGIATQMLVERQLASEGKSKHDLGREEFVRRVWEWKETHGGRILEQMKRAGMSVDWSRNRFTMDEGLSRAVREAFVRLYEKGLIYRGEYMVNWCPRCHTALSDLETVHEEMPGHLWHIRYPLSDGSGFVTVATTRPETMLGDTAVAMHPDHPRGRDLRGKSVILPLMDRAIPIVLDEMADPEFGSGFVKITPSHDPNDFEAGRRHHLPMVKVINEDAKMTAEAGAYAGLDRFEARKRVVEDLENLGLLEKVEDYKLSAGRCQRCRTIVEPLVSKQWWVSMKPLAEPAIAAVEDGRIEIIPGNWKATYFHWMRNIRDWCVSRQLWWGHRIPAWHCGDCGAITVARQDPDACSQCRSKNITQDPDVLDTWFSSGLWPFSTLGWPDETPDLRKYYPTSLLVTGFDIIFFWMARMAVFGLEMMGEAPFRQVHIHGLIRDAERQKMSKTKGNVIDPLEVNEKYGTDAVRFTLLVSAAAGADIALSDEKMLSMRGFANKIWNASRLIFGNMETSGIAPALPNAAPPAAERLEDRWILSRLNESADIANRALREHRLHEAADAMWKFFWDDFCDWYLELKKPRLTAQARGDWDVLLYTYEASLRLLHPMMPFLTEELWQMLAGRAGAEANRSISLAAYPRFDASRQDGEAQIAMAGLQGIITSARALRADHKIDTKAELKADLFARGAVLRVARDYADAIRRLAKLDFTLHEGIAPGLEGAVRSTPDFDLKLHLPELAAEGVDALRARLEKEITQLEGLIANSERQLTNEEFLSKAPEKVISSIRQKKSEYEAQLGKSRSSLETLAK
ncbi:MAG: valine--tRNA ligase [Bryobacteraceae bacterium]|nr:valine--tRNA ligase [Bryobacteraceae bacterium]